MSEDYLLCIFSLWMCLTNDASYLRGPHHSTLGPGAPGEGEGAVKKSAMVCKSAVYTTRQLNVHGANCLQCILHVKQV
eukprot:scaffold123816_cov48-Prasinocladus_malaysianus.AAC.1